MAGRLIGLRGGKRTASRFAVSTPPAVRESDAALGGDIPDGLAAAEGRAQFIFRHMESLCHAREIHPLPITLSLLESATIHSCSGKRTGRTEEAQAADHENEDEGPGEDADTERDRLELFHEKRGELPLSLEE